MRTWGMCFRTARRQPGCVTASTRFAWIWSRATDCLAALPYRRSSRPRIEVRANQLRANFNPCFYSGATVMSENLLSIPCTTIKGEQKTLADFAGKAVLVVNTASKCGFTPQYKGLEKIWQDYKDQGLVVLGFPCNQFGKQEPGNESAISEFCELNFGVTFPLFKKIDVNGSDAHPLFVQLKKQAPGLLGSERIKWNFTKFLIGKDGKLVKRFAPLTKPEDLTGEIEALLK